MTPPFLRRPAAALVLLLSAVTCTPFHAPVSPPPPPAAVGQAISRADALADLDSLVRRLEAVHPDLYATWPRDSAIAARRAIEASIPATESRVELWRRLAPFVASFGDGHTSLAVPGEELSADSVVLVFPPNVTIDADGHVVVTVALGGRGLLQRGDRLISINGLDTDSLARRWKELMSGERDAFRMSSVATQFRPLLQIDGVRAPFVVRAQAPGAAARTVTLEGIRRDSLMAIVRRGPANAGAGAAAARAAPISYRQLGERVGYMNWRTMSGDVAPFARTLDSLFTQVARDSDRVLILDLRENGGGDSRLGDEFLRHITTTAYRMSSRKDWKASDEYRAWLETGLAWPARDMKAWRLSGAARAYLGAKTGAIVPFEDQPKSHSRADPFFAGPVCVLIGGATFSSATDLSDAIGAYHLATLVGEETGGRPTSFGEGYQFRLPRSALFVQASTARFVRSNGDAADRRGVLPDIPVVPTAADRAAGRDAALERAKGCPARAP